MSKQFKQAALLSLAVFALGFRQAEWQEVKSAKENFIVSMPGVPKQERPGLKGTLGTYHHTYTARSGGVIYTLDTSRLEIRPRGTSEIKTMLTFVNMDFLRETGLRVRILGNRELSLGGFIGNELRAESGKKVRTLHAYVVKDRLYQLTTTEPKAEGRNPDTAKFFESFKLLVPPQ